VCDLKTRRVRSRISARSRGYNGMQGAVDGVHGAGLTSGKSKTYVLVRGRIFRERVKGQK
jgi:hypothetical protein